MQKKKPVPLKTKLKNLEIKKRYVVLVVLAAVCFRFWGENSITMLQKEVPIVTDTEISLEEVSHYMETRQQYLTDQMTVDSEQAESPSFEENLDKDTHEWFLVRRWRPSRFFYVEKRIKLILSLIENQDIQLSEADRLDEQADNLLKIGGLSKPLKENTERAAFFAKQAEDIRYYIKREIFRSGISNKEENIIRDYRAELTTLTKE